MLSDVDLTIHAAIIVLKLEFEIISQKGKYAGGKNQNKQKVGLESMSLIHFVAKHFTGNAFSPLCVDHS